MREYLDLLSTIDKDACTDELALTRLGTRER